MFEIDDGAVKRVRESGPTLPFSRKDLNGEEALVVHFKVASLDKMRRLEIATAITEALRDVRVHGCKIIPILTDENVEMSATDARALAAHVVPFAKQALGIP